MNRSVPQLKRRLKRARITHDRVAEAASVHRTMVSKVLNGRAVSRPVVFVIERLLLEHEAAR